MLFLPADYSPAKKWPAIMYLHGAGECGSDGLLQTTVGLGPYVKEREQTFPFVVIFPQCEETNGQILKRWGADSPDSKRAMKILDEVTEQYQLDPQKITLTGWSMGGYGVWSWGAAAPNKWASIVPLAGGGDDSWGEKLKNVRTWAFHGALDNIIKVDESRKIVEAIRKAGGQPIYTEFAREGHGIWRNVYSRDELYRWLMNPKSIAEEDNVLNAPSVVNVPAAPFAGHASDRPFQPAMYLPRAVSIRLGNDMLSAMSDAVPGMVPEESLSGYLNNISDTTSASGRSFNVTFSNISYSAKLHRVVIKARGKDDLLLQIGLRNIQLVIGSTFISGGPRSASAGPMGISIGHVRPVWVNIVVRPEVEKGKIKLRLVGTQFTIPDDNWAVGGPSGISTRGIGMTQDRVYDGLVSGMWSSKGRIESQVTSVVPSMLQQFEDRMEFSQFDRVLSGVWPLPIAAPQVMTWAEDVSTDSKGVTLVLGATLGSVDASKTPKEPKWSEPLGPKLADIPQTADLQVGFAPKILNSMTKLLVDAGIAKINVLDTPAKSLAALTDPATVGKAIPDLPQGNKVELTSELALSEPLQVNPLKVSKEGEKGSRLELFLPDLKVLMAYRTPDNPTGWKPLATISSSVRQPATLELLRKQGHPPTLVFDWSGNPDIKLDAKLAQDFPAKSKSIDAKAFEKVITAGWKEFTAAGPASRVAIPDLEYGITKLRVSALSWQDSRLVAKYAAPALKLANKTKSDWTYRVKGPFTEWSPKFTLKPGTSTVFEVSYPMLIEYELEGRPYQFSLSAGSNSELRSNGAGTLPTMYQVAEKPSGPDAG
ncbi:MAG: alpha/beta hydrolase-fold protein [Planctomycetales bacterium]